MASRTRTTGGNLIFASVLAALSYLPFKLIAKVCSIDDASQQLFKHIFIYSLKILVKSTLIVCIAVFVIDPFPTSRLVAVGGEYV
jgi:hypothetical protein